MGIRSLDELPERSERIKKYERLELQDYFNLEKEYKGPAWGSVVNNPCELYKTNDGRWIELYLLCGNISSIFIEITTN